VNRLLSDRYLLSRQLGEGGFSSVYQATDTRLDREVAVKILKTSLSDSKQMVERFLREAKLTASLRHPNSLRIFDYGHSEDDLYIVSELLTGQSLDLVLQTEGSLNEQWLCNKLIPLCMALQEAHEIGIVHRDLKPSNIFLHRWGNEERLVLIDFGISKGESTSIDKVTKTGQLFGTPHYMSPEQIRRPNSVTHHSDLYSLGVIIFELVSGQLPFDGENMFDLLTAHLKLSPPKLSTICAHCSIEIETLVLSLLEKNPNLRPQSSIEVAERLRRIMSDLTSDIAPNLVLYRKEDLPSPQPNELIKPIQDAVSSQMDTLHHHYDSGAQGFSVDSEAQTNKKWLLIALLVIVTATISTYLSRQNSTTSAITDQVKKSADKQVIESMNKAMPKTDDEIKLSSTTEQSDDPDLSAKETIPNTAANLKTKDDLEQVERMDQRKSTRSNKIQSFTEKTRMTDKKRARRRHQNRSAKKTVQSKRQRKVKPKKPRPSRTKKRPGTVLNRVKPIKAITPIVKERDANKEPSRTLTPLPKPVIEAQTKASPRSKSTKSNVEPINLTLSDNQKLNTKPKSSSEKKTKQIKKPESIINDKASESKAKTPPRPPIGF
jgi:serine/threonine protein kinase